VRCRRRRAALPSSCDASAALSAHWTAPESGLDWQLIQAWQERGLFGGEWRAASSPTATSAARPTPPPPQPRVPPPESPPAASEMTKLHVFGKWHDIPRKQVTYGDPELTYTYSGVTFSPKPWIPVLNRIRDRIALDTGHTFNFVLINRYKDGGDHIGEHRDDERELVPRSPIASVSFGACRDFVFRHCDSRGKNATRHMKPIKLQLAHGSLLMMKYPTNVYWYHSLPIRKRVLAPRINLTFRKVMTVAKK
uniref:DNA oxidative demethylase ALKBH2 n=1 Tax=Calidris pygmaea TaxID=425635 RepID=A0A8C3KI60_9CHAR